jgi:3-oxoacyl-[acyl-carrier protein] reductase
VIDLGLDGRRAIVIGAGFRPDRAGHGRATARRHAEAGATVACIDIDEGRANAIVAEIEAAGGRARRVLGDMVNPVEARRCIDEAVQVLGGVDVCVDIIGEARFEISAQHSDEDWNWEMSNNLFHNFSMYKALVPHLVRQGTGGSIVSIASVDGIGSSKYHVAYGAAKAGVISLVKTFSEELGPYGVRVNAVAPGNVGGGVWDAPEVPFGSNPVNPLAPPRPHDIADAILFLASKLSSRITGQTLIVDGGATTRSPWGITEADLGQFRKGLPGGPST